MATATTLLEDACDTGISCLQDRDLLVAIAQALADSLGMTATELLQAACTSGISCLQERDLMIVIAQATNDGGGGVGGAIEVYEGRDPLPPDDPTKGALSYPTGGGTLTQWSVGAQAWV
jgi:hypothetical protein